MDKNELTAWGLANGWRMIAGCPSLTKPSSPEEAIVRTALKATERCDALFRDGHEPTRGFVREASPQKRFHHVRAALVELPVRLAVRSSEASAGNRPGAGGTAYRVTLTIPCGPPPPSRGIPVRGRSAFPCAQQGRSLACDPAFPCVGSAVPCAGAARRIRKRQTLRPWRRP